MAFVLEKKEDMQNIYEMAKKVYDRQISADEAAALLSKKTEAKVSIYKAFWRECRHPLLWRGVNNN